MVLFREIIRVGGEKYSLYGGIMKRVFALLLAVAMVIAISLFAGCGNTNPPESTPSSSSTETTNDTKGGDSDQTTGSSSDETTGSSSTEPVSETTPGSITPPEIELDGIMKLPGYEDVDFRGAVIKIAAHTDHSSGWNCGYEIYSEDKSTIAVAARRRNDIMKANYNCTIELIPAEEPVLLAAAAVAGGQDKIDLYSIMYYQGNYDNAYNLLGFDINFSNPWWDHQWVKATTVKDSVGSAKMFSVIGDFALTSGRATFALMYDRNVYSSSNINDDVYQLVRDKKWTMDKFMEMITLAAKENSGNSKLKWSEGDLMGCVTSGFGAHSLHAASGLPIISVEDGIMRFAISDEISAWSDVIDKAIEIWAMPGVENIEYNGVHAALKNSSSLFFLKDLGSLEVIADVNVSLGLLPMPLYSESQENYAHHVDNHVMHYAVPLCVTEIEVMADFLELFAYHSRYTTRQAWIDTYSIEYCGDVESGEMLDIILSTRTYDPGYLYLGLEGELSAMIQSGKNNVARWADRAASKAAEGIASHVTTRTGYQN